jgi:hypothetical protein
MAGAARHVNVPLDDRLRSRSGGIYSTMNTKTRVSAGRAMVAAMLLALAIPATVGAAGSGAAAVSGVQRAYGTCGDNSDGYEMTGDLDGCWWITSFNPDPRFDDKHNGRATGTELFVGWIGDRYGSFETTFQYTAKMDGPWLSSAEIHGRCHHPIDPSSGTGDFVGISGELSFKDVLSGPDSPNYPYWGNVRIAGEQISLGAATVKAATSGTATTAFSC